MAERTQNKILYYLIKGYLNPIFLILSLSTLIFATINKTDVFLPITLVFFCVFLFLYSIINKPYRFFLVLFSLTVFFSTIVFPFAYLIIIRNDPSAFEINENLKNREEEERWVGLEDEYKSFEYEKIDSLITQINNSRDLQLQRTLGELKSTELVKIGDILIDHTRYVDEAGIKMLTMIVIDVKNNRSFKIPAPTRGYDDQTLSDYLTKSQIEVNNTLIEHSQAVDNILKHGFWNYTSLLIYTWNIYDTPNFNPISRAATTVYGMHKILISIFALGLILNIITEFVVKKQPT